MLLLWSSQVSASRTAFDALARDARALADAGIGALAIALDAPPNPAPLRERSAAGLPVTRGDA